MKTTLKIDIFSVFYSEKNIYSHMLDSVDISSRRIKSSLLWNAFVNHFVEEDMDFISFISK